MTKHLSTPTYVAILVLSQAHFALGAEPLKGTVQHDTRPPLAGDAMLDEEGNSKIPAGLKFDETVSPVGPELKPHKLFSSVTLPVEDNEDTWYKIPSWRAGHFHREKQINHTQNGDVESISKADHVYGMQKDKHGNIWHHVSWPKITKISLDGYSQYKMINRYEPVTMNEKEYCVKICSTNVDVDDKTGKIIRTARQEEFDRYFPVGDGIARGDCIIQGFSQHGRVNTELEKCSVEEEMVQPFSVVNTFRGKNLKESFVKFLNAHNLSMLIPEN